MRTIPSALQTHLSGRSQTLATLWRIVRRDGQVFRFTDHDQPLTVGGETYEAATGYARSALTSGIGLSVGEGELTGLLSGAFTEQDIRNGLWDYAAYTVRLVNWAAPNDGTTVLHRGWLGEVTTDERGVFRAELRGLTQRLQQRVGEVYTPECRADVFDHRCKLDVAAWTEAGEVASVPARARIVAAEGGAAARPTGWFDGGALTMTDGANAGATREVLTWDAATRTFVLFEPFPHAVAPGDAFVAYPGCDKRPATCKEKFGNFLNFRGEPLVPGADAMLAVGRPAP